MTISGHVQNGVVVFDEPITLPEGTAVNVVVEIRESSNSQSSLNLWDRLKDVVGQAEGLPTDAASRVDYYLTHRT